MLLLLSITFSGPSAAAIYKLTFTGTFNDNDVEGSIHNRASFTELIGATHTAGNPLWQPGVLATIGIENVAEQGEGAELEIEINNAINTGTAASMFITDFLEDFPDVTSIVIEVPDTHTYITAISMVAPSPDWFIGVYDLALQSGGNWIADLTVDLMPWDAGTEEGDTFSLSNPASNPHIPVAQRSSSPFIGWPVIGTLRFELITPNGDINENGNVDAGDLVETIRFMLGLVTPTLQQLTRADIMPLDPQGNPAPDGQVTLIDVLRLEQLLMGL